jgi:hypothetical protein
MFIVVEGFKQRVRKKPQLRIVGARKVVVAKVDHGAPIFFAVRVQL